MDGYMKMEKVNANTIRVTLEEQDLIERGMTVLDLLGNQNEIENFFYSILQEVDVEQEFKELDAVTFQVMPKKDGLEIFITRVNFDQLPQDLDFSFPYVEDDDESEEEILQAYIDHKKGKVGAEIKQEYTDYYRRYEDLLAEGIELDELKKVVLQGNKNESLQRNVQPQIQEYIFEFNDFEDFATLAQEFNHIVENDLYSYQEKYYLVLGFKSKDYTPKEVSDIAAIAFEYGEKAQVTLTTLQEHGRLLHKNAFDWVKEIF